MKTKSLFILLCLLLFPYIVQAGDTPGTYTWYQFDPSLTGLTSVDYGITVKVDPGYRANVYWSNQFGLVGTSNGGYTGMQSNGGSDRTFLVSVWGATQYKNGSPGSYCLTFGGEGTGISCRMHYNWTQGHTYQFHVAYEGGQWLGVTVTDLTTHDSFKLGSILTAATSISTQGMVNWTEYFEWSSPNSNCYNQPFASAHFDLPSGNGGRYMASISSTNTSKTCTSFSRITQDNTGSEQINGIGNSLRGAVMSANDGRCVDAKDGNTNNVPAISQGCNGGAGQAWVYAVDGTLRLESNLCLDVAYSNPSPGAAVIAYSCSGNPNQQWTLTGNQLVSKLSGYCLTEGKGSAQLTVQSCSGAAGQQWKLPLPPQ